MVTIINITSSWSLPKSTPSETLPRAMANSTAPLPLSHACGGEEEGEEEEGEGEEGEEEEREEREIIYSYMCPCIALIQPRQLSRLGS